MGQIPARRPLINHLYIHYPFCLRKCPYCSFYSVTDTGASLQKDYFSTLREELLYYQQLYRIKPKTIYLGGGTPSLANPAQWAEFISKVDTTQLQEFTLEVNPGTVNENNAVVWKELGINRISIGAQTFSPQGLHQLGRIHTPQQTRTVFTLLRKVGFINIGLDLLWGYPGQTRADLDQDLREYTTLQPEHISTYNLSLDEKPNLKQSWDLPDDETSAKMYHHLRRFFERSGYRHYEIANFCRPGMASKHNSVYWQDKSYLGLGPAAHSYISGAKRWANPSQLTKWQDGVKGNNPKTKTTCLSMNDWQSERAFLALRTSRGLNRKIVAGFNPTLQNNLNLLIAQGFLTHRGNVRLKKRYYYVSNEIFARLLPE